MSTQTRHVRGHMEKTHTIISLMDWNIIMFDHKGDKIVKVIWIFQSTFHKSNLKNWSPKKYEVKGHNMYNPY